jgi:hypothetical protein
LTKKLQKKQKMDGSGGGRSDSDGLGMATDLAATDLAATDPAATDVVATDVAATDRRATLVHCTKKVA